jgi:hypothetical protein
MADLEFDTFYIEALITVHLDQQAPLSVHHCVKPSSHTELIVALKTGVNNNSCKAPKGSSFRSDSHLENTVISYCVSFARIMFVWS